jgi:hypothetical protein
MRRTLRFVAVGAILSLVAFGGWLWSGQAHAAQRAPQAPSPARARGHHRAPLLTATLAPSVPTDPAIFGVEPGGAPWQLSHGHVRLDQNGALHVNVARLVLTTTGSNPVPDLAAAVYCNGVLSSTTSPVRFSKRGNARIHAIVSLPSLCPAPAVLLNPATGSAQSDVLGVYIGFDGTA